MPGGFVMRRQDMEDNSDPLDLTRKSNSTSSTTREQLRRQGKILSAPVWRPAVADDFKNETNTKTSGNCSPCGDSPVTPEGLASGAEVLCLEAALRWYHQRLPFLGAPGAPLYPTLPFTSSLHLYPHYASLLVPPLVCQSTLPASPTPVRTPSPKCNSDGLDLTTKYHHRALSSPENQQKPTENTTAPITAARRGVQTPAKANIPSSEANKRASSQKGRDDCSSKKAKTTASSKRQKAVRKLTFDDELISPVSGTFIRDASEMEDGMVLCPGDIDPAFNVVEITEEARAELAKIENRIGDYVCRLCRVLFEDAFGLAQHRCPRIVHVEYRCPECDKVFNCPANLASHRRWHKPKQPLQSTKNATLSVGASSRSHNSSHRKTDSPSNNNFSPKDRPSDAALLARHLLDFAKGNLNASRTVTSDSVSSYALASGDGASSSAVRQESSQQTSPLRLLQGLQVRAVN